MSKNDIQVLVVEDDVMVAEVIIGFLDRVGQVHVVDHSDSLLKSKELLNRKQIESIKEARKYGVKDYLVKPFKYKRFEQAISNYRSEVMKLKGLESLDQLTIDVLMHNKELEPQEGVNKTYDRILVYLKEHYPNGYTSSEIAEALGVSRITARRYLENMEYLKVVELELYYGAVGRPQNKFSYKKK